MLIYSPQELSILAIKQRKKLGLTQAEVADRVGLKQKTISAFENRPESVMLATAFLILTSLGLELELNADASVPAKEKEWQHEW